MSRIIIDSALRTQLMAISQPVELCDESGRVLGRFTPAVGLSEFEFVGPQVSDEELERRSQSKEKYYTTAEVLAHLEKL